MKRLLKLWLPFGAAAAAAFLWRADGAAHAGLPGVTWATASRLLETHCAACHGEGRVQPRLDDYESARLASPAIKRAVLSRHKPGWYADPAFGDYRNDPSLTAFEAELLAQWADGRAPFGDAAARPVTPVPPAAPDLWLRVPSRYRIEDASRTFVLPTALVDDRWIRGWTFQPGNPAFVTAATISLATGETIGTWVEGQRGTDLPEGVTRRLPAGATVHLTVYYRPSPRPAVDASSVGLYFADRPGRELAQAALPCGTWRVPRSIEAMAIRPPLGARGDSLAVVARRPDGSVEPLGRFVSFPAAYPQTYWLRRPVRLPRGTEVRVDASHGVCAAEIEYVPSGGAITPVAADLPGRPSPADRAAASFWCPMHTTERAPGPGPCPQCGMPLVPMVPTIDGQYALDARLEPARGSALRLAVRDPRSGAIVRRFEEVHERPFHLFLVSDDLETFHHLHPAARPDGTLELSRVPLRSGFHVFADFLPEGGTPQLIGKAIAPAVGKPRPALVPDLRAKTDGRLRVRLAIEGGALIAGQPALIDFHLEDPVTGAPIGDLEPYLGAWGHAFIVSEDMVDAVHSHPLTPRSSAGESTIVFQQRFPRAGVYRLWAQFLRGGRLSTVSFTVSVTDGASR